MALSAAADAVTPRRKAMSQAWMKAGLNANLDRLVVLWVFLGGFTIIEPSPYEFGFALVLPVAIFASMKLYRPIGILLVLTAVFTPFAVIAAFQVVYTPLSSAILYPLITVFLMLTAYFSANYVAEFPQVRMRRIMQAYTAVAVFSAIVGTLGYLRLIPGAYDLLTRSSRAKALFEDPNVFGPFLVLPAMYAVQRIMMLRNRKTLIINGLVVMALLIGVFVSFSRAAWGHMVGSAALLFLLVFILEANARDKVRMLILGMVGVALSLAAIGGLLAIPEVGDLFANRAQVEQYYDSGENGRFGRQGYAFDMGLSNPFGIGPGEFKFTKISEEAHDSFATTLHVYGWGGALIWDVMLVLTLYRGFAALLKPSPNRRLLIPLLSVFLPLVIEGGIIDIDHWRHYYLIMGLIWGVTTGYKTVAPGENKVTALA
jgi:hypothetical protein